MVIVLHITILMPFLLHHLGYGPGHIVLGSQGSRPVYVFVGHQPLQIVHFLFPLGLPQSPDFPVVTCSSDSLHNFMITETEEAKDKDKNH